MHPIISGETAAEGKINANSLPPLVAIKAEPI